MIIQQQEECKMDLKVVGARCIIKEDRAEAKTKSGIIIANSNQEVEPKYTGVVLAVGDGAYLENGNIKPMTVAVGDRVMYAKFSGTPINYKEQEYIILNERDILAIAPGEQKA